MKPVNKLAQSLPAKVKAPGITVVVDKAAANKLMKSPKPAQKPAKGK